MIAHFALWASLAEKNLFLILLLFFFQSLCFSVSCVCVNAFHTGLLSVEEAIECADKLQKIVDKHPQVSCILRFHCKFKFKFL